MSVGNTIMIFGLGDLGGWVMELLARRQGVTTIIGCDKNEDWGSRKVDCVAAGSGAEGYYKMLKFEKCDVFDVDATAELISKYSPDLVYSSMTLMTAMVLPYFPHDVHEDLKKIASTTLPVHLLLPYKLMQAVEKSGCEPVRINNAFPDLVNPMLCRSGLKVHIGAGNVDNVVLEIGRKISVKENVPIRDVKVYLIYEHVINVMGTRTGIPYFLKIMIGDKDITSKYDPHSLISDRLVAPYPVERSNWVHYPYVASGTVKTIMAFINDTNELTHAPGPNGLIGGYSIRIGAKGVQVELPQELTLEQAIKINVDGARAEGVEEIREDGTLVVTDDAYQITKRLLGVELREFSASNVEDVIKELLPAFKKLADKYKVKGPIH